MRAPAVGYRLVALAAVLAASPLYGVVGLAAGMAIFFLGVEAIIELVGWLLDAAERTNRQ